jgi:hypothetical protein
MKTIKIKSGLITCLAVIMAWSVSASPGDMKSIMENIKAQKKEVNEHLSKLNRQQDRVVALKKECKEQKSAAAHKNLKEAKADLKATKSTLKKEGKELMRAHKAHIKHHKADIRAEVDQLEKAQRAQDKAHIRQNPSVLAKAETTMDSRAELRERMTDLERARLNRDKDNWVINREFKDRKGETELQLTVYPETSPVSSTQ